MKAEFLWAFVLSYLFASRSSFVDVISGFAMKSRIGRQISIPIYIDKSILSVRTIQSNIYAVLTFNNFQAVIVLYN
jgi:hypothetical protein